MTTETESESKYPSWRDALFSDDTVANIRCAIKYVFWHVSYALLTVGVVIGGSILALVSLLNEKIPSDRISSGLSRAGSWIARATPSISSSTKKKLGRVATVMLFVVMVGLYVILAALNPITMLFTTAGVVGLAVLTVVGTIAWEWAADRIDRSDRVDSALGWLGEQKETTESTAKQMPGVRRVYGECPVHMDIEPRWFDDLME